MKNEMPEHYWRVHARVTKRVWADTPLRIQAIIACDENHETPEFQWFEAKVNGDAMRLFTDAEYYDNTQSSFKMSQRMR
jgi:hypothetical protein